MKRSKNMRYKVTRILLMLICLFIGVGAVYGSMCMFIDPSGKFLHMDAILHYFEVLPFSNILFKNYIFSGISLLIVNGITNLCAFILILCKKKIGIILGTIFGFTLMLWITIQFIILPSNVLSTTCFILGCLQLVIGYICFVSYKQENFKIDVNDYLNINSNHDELVVYFSRTGYTKKIALEIANKSGADVVQIIQKEKIKGTIGFFWCGRFGVSHIPMEIENINIDFSKYKKVTICSPIWVFGMSAPIRMFCKVNKDKINNVNYVLVHYMRANFKNVADEMDKLLNVKHDTLTNYCVRLGEIKSIKSL